MRYIKLFLIPSCVFALLSIVIFAQPMKSGSVPNKLSSKTWYLQEINNEKIATSNAYLKFNKPDKSISGNGGCNQIFGSFEINGSRLSFRDIGSTKMFCSEGDVMIVESNFLNALKKVNRYVISGKMLTLFIGREALLKFSSVKIPIATDPNPTDVNSKISGRKWILSKIAFGEVPKTEEVAFIMFDNKKGTVSGNTSCNTFGGKYVLKEGKIRISEVVSTKRFCSEGQSMRVEFEMLNGMQRAERLDLAGETLVLALGRFTLLRFTEKK